MAKRKTKSVKKQSNILKIIAWILAVIAFGMSFLALGYFIGYENASEKITLEEKKKERKRLALLQKIEDKTFLKNETINYRLQKVLQKEAKDKVTAKVKKQEIKEEIQKVKSYAGASHEYATSSSSKPPQRVKKKSTGISVHKPKLAIIMDDVSVKSQVNAIKSLGLNITMSFLPPSKGRPHSASLAAKEKFYMVHLPMEAQSFSAEEPNTLRINDSQHKISQRVKKIKALFPKVRYINNHTGSKYTSNEPAMNRLITALNANNISFIDSRTTAKTTAPKVMKNFGFKYVARDVFLDHHMDKPYIKKQIKNAIRIAKAEGSAIAIGHPHSNTILALYESKKLFKDVDLVLINKMY